MEAGRMGGVVGLKHREELGDRVAMAVGGFSHPVEDLCFRARDAVVEID
jgi:hypothetical protein